MIFARYALYGATAMLLGSSSLALAQSRDLRGKLDFQGRYIVSISDADMVASAYVNGKLGPLEGRDALSVIQLGGDPRGWRAAEVEASNSVAGPPSAVDITPDGKYAFVIETFTPRPGRPADTFNNLKMGSKLLVFSLADPQKPRLIHTVNTAKRPDAIRVNKQGTLVAVTFHPAGGGKVSPMALYRFDRNRLGKPTYPSLAGWDQTDRMIDIDWHPTEPVLAMLNATKANMRFATVNEDLTIESLGNTVDIEKEPFRLHFTPDGRHVIANAVYWGADVGGRWVEAPRGSVLSVRYRAGKMRKGGVRHALVSTIKTGVSPEGLAVSPDGQWIATSNLERSYLPYGDKRITWFSSVTLARLEPATGALSKVGDFSYDGILPEALVFDNSSRYLAVATYDHFDDRRKGGSVDFWRVQADPLEPSNVQLIKTEHSIPVTRGVHSMVIAR